MIEISWTFAVLEAFAFALVATAQGELGYWKKYVNPRFFLYARGVLGAVAFVGSQVYSNPPTQVMVGLGAAAVLLGILGYWPQIQQVGNRIKGD